MPKTIKLRPTALDDDLPLHPSIVRRVREIAGRAPNARSEDDLLQLISADPSLAARALRIASAPIFGQTGAMTTLSHALAVIGPSPFCSLASGIADRRGAAEGEVWAAWWAHALHAASIARALSEKLRFEAPEEAYVAGLLHDIGKGYMAVANPEAVMDIAGSDDESWSRREREVFGTTHEDLGGALAKQWNLGAPLLAVLRLHHAPTARTSRLAARDRSLVAIVAAASGLAHAREPGGGASSSGRATLEPAASLGLRAASLRSACQAADESLLRTARALGLHAANVADLYREPSARPTRRNRLLPSLDGLAEPKKPSGLPSLVDVLHDLRSKPSFTSVIEAALEALRTCLGFDRATFLEKARHGRTYRAIRIVDGARQRARATLRLSPGGEDATLARCIETRRAHVAADARRDRSILEHFGATQMGLAPVVSRGQVVGLLAVDNFASRSPITDGELALVEVVAGEAGLLLDNHTLQSQEALLKEFAEKDAITGISNRRYAIELGRKEVDRARRYGTPLSLVMLDLDDFKELNDRYGHLAGDRVISEVARILAANSRRTDVLGRYGGDEFMALLPEIGREQALAYAERMRSRVEEFAKKLEPEYPKVSLSISVGVSTLQPGGKLEDLIQSADSALYAAKEAGKNRVCLNE
ncbi:MAG: diguanylate cyclase [Planctomycetes bacterium]|nr:diguanylate cyclase [Planctomycetota bacterium]